MALATIHDVTGTSTKATLTKQLWDSKLHGRVQDKQSFKNLIGRDVVGESSIDSTTSSKPIVEKTQLGKESGDQITMGLAGNLSSNPLTAGFTGVESGIDNEDALALSYLKVKIAHNMLAAGFKGRMNEQRSPYNIKSTIMEKLSEAQASYLDSSVPITVYSGYSPNVMRELGLTIAAPTAHPNRIAGKNKSALTDLTTADIVDTELLEFLRVFIQKNNTNPCAEGKNIFLIDPNGGKTLRADSHWVDGANQNMPRGKSWVFENGVGEWAGIIVQETNKLSTAKNYAAAGATRSGSGTGASPYTLSFAAADVGALTATDVRMNILLGGNAVARAVGLNSYMEKRKEDAYGLNQAWASGMIYGEVRCDWTADADNSTIINQSSALVYTYSPSVISAL